MARKKRKSKAVENAKKRLAGLESIDPALDLGNGNTVLSYNTAINSVDGALESYNTSLSDGDGLLNIVMAEEQKLKALSEKMLEAVATKYGHDSNEYEKAGGTRKSEFKRRKKKPKPPSV